MTLTLFHETFQNFGTGETNVFTIATKGHMGHLTYIQILHDNSGNGKSASWFLEKIIVRDATERHS